LSLPVKYETFSIEKFDVSKFSKESSVSFTGSAVLHPYEEDKFVLICDPLSEHTEFIEFFKKDLACMEEVESISLENGENVIITKVWIKSGSLALKVHPFIVTKTSHYLKKFAKKD